MKRRNFLQAILGAAGLASVPKVAQEPAPSSEAMAQAVLNEQDIPKGDRHIMGFDLAIGPDHTVETILSYHIKTGPDGKAVDIKSFVHPKLRRGRPDE